MFKYSVFAVLLGLLGMSAIADQTDLGKIVYTQGHVAANCRTVKFKENQTGVEMYFRIADSTSDDDVSSIVLAAMMTSRDVSIFYNPGETTGCGTEPKIVYVTIY